MHCKMKASGVIFSICFLCGAFGFDYDISPVEDPLQPIWMRLESLSNDILGGFDAQMQKFLQQTQENIENKFQNLKLEIANKTGDGAGDMHSLAAAVKNEVTAWIENFYMETMKADNEDAILKAERGIKTKIDGLENKMIEHINVKFAAMTSSPNSSSQTSIMPTTTQIRDLETRVINHITGKLTDIETSVSTKLAELTSSMSTSSTMLTNINKHLTKIAEELSSEEGRTSEASSSSGGSSESCSGLLTKVNQLMNGSQLSTSYLEQQETRWKEIQTVMAEVRETPSYLARDCSDIHWLHHESRSDVYEIYPTLDRKGGVYVYCDMAEDRDKADGGWTVLLRRQKTDFGLENFNRTWREYARGFGQPGGGEWWFSLSHLHALSYRQPYSVQFVLRDKENNTYYANYKTFRVEDEANKYRLIVDGFDGNVSNSFASKHHGMDFSTSDEDNDQYPDGSCAVINGGGWWFNACYYTTLTSPFPPEHADANTRTIKWMNGQDFLVLYDVTMKIRPSNYGQRFDAHTTE